MSSDDTAFTRQNEKRIAGPPGSVRAHHMYRVVKMMVSVLAGVLKRFNENLHSGLTYGHRFRIHIQYQK